MARNRERHGYPFEGRTSHSQNRRRSRASTHGADQKASTQEKPPALATDGKGAYREAMLDPWGTVLEYSGQGRPPRLPQPGKDWQYLQVIKKRQGSKLVSVTTKVIYGDPDEVKKRVGEHTAYVERTNLTSRQMNGRLVLQDALFSKELRFLKAASVLLKMRSTTLRVHSRHYASHCQTLQNTCVGNKGHLLWPLELRIISGRSRSF